MYRVVLLSVLIGLFSVSCKSAEEKKAEHIKKEVLELHDELMIQTEKLGKLKKELHQKRANASNRAER